MATEPRTQSPTPFDARYAAHKESFEPLIERWSVVPTGARYGGCGVGNCGGQDCLDPFVSVHRARSVSRTRLYDPLVLMTYWPDGTSAAAGPMLRINGEDLGFITRKEDDPQDSRFEGLQNRVRKRFGQRAVEAIDSHASALANRPLGEPTPVALQDLRLVPCAVGRLQLLFDETGYADDATTHILEGTPLPATPSPGQHHLH